MTTPKKIIRILIMPFMMCAALFVFILDKFHVNVDPIISYNHKDLPSKDT